VVALNRHKLFEGPVADGYVCRSLREGWWFLPTCPTSGHLQSRTPLEARTLAHAIQRLQVSEGFDVRPGEGNRH